jgi:CRP/FNR family transcriptional regulator, cyclic AMP receptor protein
MLTLQQTNVIIPDLPKRVAAQLFAASTVRHVKSGQALFSVGERGDGCYRIEQGVVKICVTSPAGDERILAVVGAGAIVGELALIDGLPRSASIFAFRDSTFRFISRKHFNECKKDHPEFHAYLATILAARLREADEALAAATFLPVKGRVARAFLNLAKILGEQAEDGRVLIKGPISQADLAAMAGVARENVSRMLSEWGKRKLITRSSRHYVLNDIEAFQLEIDSDASE